MKVGMGKRIKTAARMMRAYQFELACRSGFVDENFGGGAALLTLLENE